MAFDGGTRVSARTQELRIATTMTGGVSLAVWMGGVAREINLLAQASRWRRVGGPMPAHNRLSEPATASLELYARLLDLLDMVVEVDVLSGTSAGGINASLLASSRVTGSDLGGLRELWLDLGSLLDLLRDPTEASTPSLLYGDERMYAALARHLPELASGPFPPTTSPPSTTLYVTTTLLSGETSRFTDAFGTLVQDVDRRGLFTFTESDLADPVNAPALALAARSSASFPAAFEPSFLPFGGDVATAGLPDRPDMARYANITRSHWASDGGLLDNRPIDVLLRRIFDRRARRPVRRVLLFVVPSSGPAPDLVDEVPLDRVGEPLGLLDGLLKDLTAMTTQSISADLRAIRAHQDRMDARTDTRLRLVELASRLPQGSRLLTPSVLTDYRALEAARQSRELVSALLRQLSTWPPESASPATARADSVPQGWGRDLAAGGHAERVCRRSVASSIESRWSVVKGPSLPDSTADFARFDQAAYDLAKGCALAVVGAASPLASSDEQVTALAAVTEGIHAASGRPARQDMLGLVRSVCAEHEVRAGTLAEAAQRFATTYLDTTGVTAGMWRGLAEVFVHHRRALTDLVAPGEQDHAPTGRRDERLRRARSELGAYLAYLAPADGPEDVARRLFDLAVTLRAMLPVEPDPEQSVALVQVSADTRSLLAPGRQTAARKLTGMQFHHFGAFYKRSWRLNDWMWGRLDGAGWLVHVLLEPRRVQQIVDLRADQRDTGPGGPESGARWFLRQLTDLGVPEIPAGGYRVAAPTGASDEHTLTEQDLLDELAFLDDDTRELPPSLPRTSLWLAQVWQHRVLDEELGELAATVLDPQPGKPPDWSPARSRAWATRVREARPGQQRYALLGENPVADETFAGDKGSPLMARTISKAAATASGALGSVRQLPGVVKPPVGTVRTLTLGGYRVVNLAKGMARSVILAGAVLLVLGVAAAIQSGTVLGVTGLVMAAVGGYLLVLGTWQFSSRLLFALLSVTLVGAVLALATPVVRTWLFGTRTDPGLVGMHAYWLGAQWWHPLIVVGAVALLVTVVASARPSRR